MKAAAFHSPGNPDVLQIMDFENPVPKNGQVRVKVKAAGVQPVDCAIRGYGFTPPGVEIKYPQILGNEFSGVIDRLGEGVEDFSVGSAVIGWSLLSSYAEYVVVPTSQIVRKPQTMPWDEAGVLTASGQTAHTALKELGIGKGDTVLIHAAAGGVGTFAVQLAKAWGANVIGTASLRNHDYLKSLGATPVLYGEGLVERVCEIAPGGVDAALDAAGEDALRASIELVQDKKRIGTIVSFDLSESLGTISIRSKRSISRLSELTQLYEQGQLRIVISQSFPLHQVVEAHKVVETGHGYGKVVLTVDESKYEECIR
ncbi:NADP-dependent oxidoreductase [Gracilibacillus alcaliphilus]|uniref:NADP-dependent oxidoreductase n=1 Tax=Gracilibacillus alcaliphilus TaxID=1401441 RepID=UPI001956AF3E|nr:NADP-dependent oxidoreductase [Gracilibacillus alcaliphilus]MBM7678830.1 NADPH:quinone reductase-like Zn-dependent oxidoreductase [Gracilibacillus alcaliphilus]